MREQEQLYKHSFLTLVSYYHVLSACSVHQPEFLVAESVKKHELDNLRNLDEGVQSRKDLL